MINEDRKKLYDALSSEYDLGTYEEFERNIGDSVKRKKLYDVASADYDLGDFESYSQRIGPTHKESLDAFTAEHGSWLNDFEARDSAETKKMVASSRSGLYMPSENAISGEERKRYMELHKQEEALKKAWFTSDEYLAQKDADALFLSNVQKDLSRQRVEYAQANPPIKQEGLFQINPYAVRGVEADTELERFATASRLMDDAIKMHNAPSRYDDKNVFLKFGKGAGDVLSDADFWTAGLTEIADNLGVRDVLSTVQEKLGNLNDLSEEAIENILSPAEKAVLQAWAINTQEQLKRKDDLSRAYQAGQGATESLGFMAEFALTGGIGKAATEGVEQMVKWLGKKALTKVGGMTDDVAAKVLKETGEKIAQSTVGKYGVGLAESLAEAAGRTGVMPSTFRNISEKATEIETDENGNNYLVKMNDAFAKGYVDSFIENLSEGGRVNALGTLFGDVAGKIPAYKKMVDKFSHTKASELWDAFNSSGVMNTLRAGGWHGLGEEYLEEWYGNALRTLTGVDKEALKDFATVDNQIITLTSFLPMTIFGGTVSTAQVLSANKDLEKKAAALKSALMERGYDEAQANNMIDMMRGAAPAEVSETLTPIVNSVANKNTNEAAALMKPVGEFAAAVQRWQSFNTKYNYQEQEQRDGLRAQMEENLGQFWQQDENGRQTVQRGVNEKGEVVYMLGKPSVEDVEAGVTTEVAAVTSDGRKVFVNPSEYQLEDELEMNTFLGNEIMAEKGNQEQARMIEEKEAKIAAIRETAVPGTAVNIGTAEAPMQAIVLQRNPDGVIVNTPDGQTRQMTYEEFGNYVGVNAVPMTDAQIDEHEADVLTADRAQREAALDQEYENEDAALEELSEAEDEIEQAVDSNIPLPMKADGSVDQTALWNNDPERWAQWNDEQRQDGGANSLAYVSGAIAKEQAKIAELQAAYAAESDFDARDAIEKEIADTQARAERLTSIQQGYVAQAAVANGHVAPAKSAPAQTESIQATLAATQQERTVESVLASLNDGTLADEEIRANIDANLAEAQKAYDKYAKKAPKMGTDKAAYLAEKQEYEQGLPVLQQEIDFWNRVKQTYENVMKQETLPTEESFRPELIEEDMAPQTPQELAASELGLKEGGIKLLWDSVKTHTGWGNGERQKFFGIFRSKDKGGMTIEAAGDRLMEIDREYDFGLLDQSDPMAGVNAILDVLGDAQTIGDLRNYIANNREVQVAREAAAAYSAMNAEFEATHGMTMEEWAHANEVQRIEIMSKSALTDAEEYERNVKFAEEENQYGANEQSTGTEGLPGGENQTDAGNVERGADSLHRQGNSILQETQSDNTGGKTISDGQISQDVSEGNNQDGDTSIHAGEQTAEIDNLPDDVSESSLDEDMPDFTSSASAYFATEYIRQRFAVLKARINDWSSKLGIKVRIMETLDDVVNQSAREEILTGKKVYGFFDVDSGEVAIYLPDFLAFSEEQALSEIDKTYIHEVVSHRGLRGLLGEKKYGELCDKVWEVMTDDQKQRYINYPGVKGNARAAADEFIAHFAENVDYTDNRTLWDKIVDFIKDFLGSIDIPVEISNESMAGLLRQSYIKLAKDAKAATNTNANQQAEGNIMLRTANGSLVGMHNISEDKLRKALKQGGLANPSTAVVNIAEYLLDGYGDISLIMPSSLVDASTGDNVGTYTGDAWTPTYPTISRQIDEDGWKLVKDRIRAAVGNSDDLYHDIVNSVDNYLSDNRNSRLEFVFLKEKGIEPKIEMKGADGYVGMRNLEAILGVEGLRDSMESYEKYKAASPMAKRSFNMWQRVGGNKKAHKDLKDEIRQYPQFAKLMGLDEDLTFAGFDSFTYSIFRKEYDAGNVNTIDTLGGASRYVDANDMRTEFDAWLESLMEEAGAKEVFFAGWTRDGDRIYKDNTLENVSRYMRMQGRTNAYNDHGLSATKSALLQRLTSLAEIRKNRARLQDEASYNRAYDKLKDRLFSVISQLADMEKISDNPFMNIDYAEARLQEAIVKRNPISYLNNEYGYSIDPKGEYADELKSFIKDVQKMPAKYFETKFERPVYLNEFAAAVMPNNTSEDVKQAITEAGLPIFEYDSDVKGARREATLKATEEEGVRFRILGELGAANLDAAEEATTRLDNLDVARQMEEAGKDAKTIRLATGWERGADKLWRYEVPDEYDLANLEKRLQEELDNGAAKTWGIVYPSDLGQLLKEYPDFNVDIMVWVGNEFENNGAYSPATEGDENTFGRSASIEVEAKTIADIAPILAHEIQHAIQEIEGFAEGGQVRGLKDKLSAELDKRVATIKQLREEGRNEEADELMQMSKGLANAVINNEDDAYGNYKKLAGEVEARNAATRIGKSIQERRESLLSETEDVAREDQIILMESLGRKNMIGTIANVPAYDAVEGTEFGDWLKFVDTNTIAKGKTQFYIANTGPILNKYGINGKINVSRKAINPKKHTPNADHVLGVQEWIDVVDTINDPIYITRYNGSTNSYRIYTIAKVNGKNICVGVDVNTANGVEITKIKTAFGRDVNLIKSSTTETVIYNKKKAAKLISGSDNSHLYAKRPSVDKGSNNLAKDNGTEENVRYRVVTDQETLNRLNSEPTIKVYRAMQLIDGKLYPPMSAKVDGELRQPIELGQWEEAEERPDLVDEKGRFKLDKGNKSSLKARYNPYFHTSPTPLNDQFSSAQTRPELVTVEVEVPESELTSGYKAEKAKDSVGKMEWKAGVVQSKLSGTRTVILSRWDKPVRIVPDSEVADVIVDMFEGRDITMPSNVVTPSLRAELEKRGVPFVETDNQGNPVEEVSFRVTGTPTDEVVANGLQLTPAQTAEVAANIFAALPEESRKKITEGLNGNVLGLKDAILQIPTSLASKENWNEEDKQMANVVAEEITKMAGEMTRPFSAEEGLWLLYNNLNKGTDLISQASRALVQRNLGFDAETLAKQEQAKEGVRFRTVGDATSNAQASLYNRGAVNVWTRLKESFVDMQASVEELVKAIEKRTGKVAQGFENILLALNQQSSKGLAAMESYTQKFLNPMFDEIRRIMDETKMKYEDIVRYVILKHGLERNKKLAQRDARAHYQEIYDDIISKINSMDDRQKRTYLTNAQLKEADAKARLATLQAKDTTSLTDEELKAHKKELAKAREEVKEAEEYRERAEKIRNLSEQEAQDELDKIFEKIENGTDSVYKEMRENDYSGISSMFYDQLGVDRKNFSTEEQYQAALMEAKKDRYSSLKDVEAAAEAEVASFEGKTDTKELWKRINAATKETLRQQYEANMISKDQYINLRDMFEYYVPLRGFKDNTAEDMYTYYRKPNSTGYTKPILGAEGRKTEAESPFGWIAAMAGSAIASNVKNEAKLALYYFVSNRPENGIATISKTWFVDSGEVDERGKKIFKPAYPPFSEDLSSAEGKAQYEIWQANMKELQKKGQAYEAGQRLNLGNAVVNISDANKPEHIVNVKVGGKDYTIIINGNPRAAQAINGDLNIEGTAQDYSALFGPVLRWMSSVNTSYNPEFWITNMMRDMAFTMMAVNIKEDPAYRRKFSKNYRKAFKVVSLVAKNEKGTIGDSYLEQQYKDFVKYGGVTGYTQIKDSETWEQEIENYLSSTDPESLKSGKVMRGMKSAFHAAHRFGESLEQVSRFAAFLTARETGKSINEAINDAKEITVNFNRKGSGKMITLEEAKYLTGKNGQPLTKPQQWMVVGLSSIAPLGRRFIMFFNAAIQGLNATYKLMKKNPKRFTGWALGYAAVGMMNAVLHAMLDDDDDYLDIPQYERRNSLMIGGNGAYFKWALPQEARAFYALGDLAVETVMGRNPHQNVLGEALKIGTEILPVNPSEGWKAFMPSVAIPFIELALNEDYKGAPIYNEQKWLSEEEKERTAKWSNAYQGTGWTYVKIAQGLNFITGGDKHDAGWINLQPEKLEHLVQSAFGGTIRTADKFINTISAALDPEEPMTIRQTPFLNRFLTINDERFKNVHVNDVFDYYKADAEHALTLEKQYIKDRDMDSLTELRSSDEYQWAKIYGKYKKPLKAIQDKIKVADGTAEKKELMKQQDELKKRMIKEISEL